MYCYTFLYPRPTTRSFDYDYHRDVHMPLGIALTEQYLGIRPRQFWIERIDEGKAESKEPYAAIVHLLFDREDDFEKFGTLASYPEAAALFAADYPRYTEGFPEVRTSRWTLDDDMDRLIELHRGRSA